MWSLYPFSPAFKEIVGSEHPAMALESHKFIQCQQQPALLGCVTEMCPCKCVSVESHSSSGEGTRGLPSLISVTGRLRQSPSWVQRGLFCALGHLPGSSQHSPIQNCLQNQNQPNMCFLLATPPLLCPSFLLPRLLICTPTVYHGDLHTGLGRAHRHTSGCWSIPPPPCSGTSGAII